MIKKEESQDLEKNDKAVCKMVDDLFKEAREYQNTVIKKEEIEDSEKFYSGEHWKDKKKTFKNFIFPIVESEMAILTDSMPGTDVIGHKIEQDDDAKMMESAIHFTYERQRLHLKQSMASRSCLIRGTGHLYVDYDPDLENGQGSVIIKNLPFRQVVFDPAATEIDEAAFVGIEIPIRVKELQRKFPKYKDQIKPMTVTQDLYGGIQTHAGKEDKDLQVFNSNEESNRYKLNGMTLLQEAWVRDYEEVEIPEEETAEEIKKETEQFFEGINPDIGKYEDHEKHEQAHVAQRLKIASEALQIPIEEVTDIDIEALKAEDPEVGFILSIIDDHMDYHAEMKKLNPGNKRPKYPFNLRLIMKSGSVVLYDGPAPVEDGKVPVVPFYCYKTEDSIYGFGEVKNMLPSQKSYNEMDHAEYESLHLTANPGFIMDSNCGVNPQTVNNQKGKIYIKNPNTEFRRLEPGQTSPQLSQRKQSDRESMEAISGITEATQGRKPGSITAAKAIERLQQQSIGRIRLKSAYLETYSMKRLGELTASRIAKYWTTERHLRITDTKTGQVKRMVYDPARIKNLDYEIRMVPGTTAGTDKEAIYEAMSLLVQQQLITPKTFFNIVDLPGKQKILEDLEASDQSAAQLEQISAENEQLKAQLTQITGQDFTQESDQGIPQEQPEV